MKKAEAIYRNGTLDKDELVAEVIRAAIDTIPDGYHLKMDDNSGRPVLNLYRTESRNNSVRVATIAAGKRLRL